MFNSEKRSNIYETCCGKPSKSLKHQVAAPGCADDTAAVASLPDELVPRHAGLILQNYLKTQEKEHLEVYDELSKGAKVINNNIESKIRIISESLLSHIKQNELDINCLVDETDKTKTIPLSSDERAGVLKCVSRLYSSRMDDIASYRREALTLERQRADELRKLLRVQFQRLVKVGFRPPRDLLHDFDQQSYEINQQLLSNCRAYANLEAQLHVQASTSYVRAKSKLNQMCLGVSTPKYRHSVTPYQKYNTELVTHPNSAHERKREASEPTIGHMIGEVQDLNDCVSIIVQAYKTAVLKVFSGFSGKLCDLHQHLGSHSFIEIQPELAEAVDLQFMIERVLRRLSSSIQKVEPSVPELHDMTRFGTLKLQKSLCTLGDCLRDTYNILHDAGHLWDAHMLRAGLAQKLTVACVEDILTSHDSIELANEIAFNIALEQLRSASDIDKLQQLWDSIIVMLERTAVLYKQHNSIEIAKLEDFMNFPETMASILMSEFHCFLGKYPRSAIVEPNRDTFQQVISSPKSDSNTFTTPLPRVILQTELQEISLINWRNGFLETFENSVSLVPDELRHQARLWVDEKARAIHMRHSLKLLSHSIRLERVKVARDRRLSEIKSHEARLESHLAAIYDLVERLPTEASEVLNLNSPELYPICDWIDGIQANIDLLQDPIEPETKRLKMCSYASRLIKHRSLFENSLDLAIDACKKQIESRIQEVRISNVRFASQLILFTEGGRYSAQEASKTSISLIRGADAIESCLIKSIEALNQRQKHLMELADRIMVPVQRVVEEFVKSSGKGTMDKKKPVPGKKK